MLQFSHLKSESYTSQAWKNGKGRTLEIAVDSEQPYRWRVSAADLVESGEFSLFPGYRRVLVLLSGLIRLTCNDARPVQLSSLQSHAFSGDASTTCEVLEKGQDLNLIFLSEGVKGNSYPTRFREGEEMHFPLRGQEHFLFLLDGEVEIFERNTQKQVTLKPFDTVRLTRPPNEEFLDMKTIARRDSRAVWVVIHTS